MKLFLYSLSSSMSLYLSPLLISSPGRPHSAQTPQQPGAIREEPTAARLINIDSVSTYPPGSVPNSRYCISTPTANNLKSIQSTAVELTLQQVFRIVRRFKEKYLIRGLPDEWSQSHEGKFSHRGPGFLGVLFFVFTQKQEMNGRNSWRR